MDQQFIDELLERYLGLLDEYTTLRQSLSQAQTGMYQNIARANFSGERGMRYGQDQYDERMQAARRLAIEVDDKQQPTFTIIDSSAEEAEVEVVKTAEETKGGEEQVKADDIEETKESSSKKAKKNKNPLHWFGLFAPMPLRTAQTQCVEHASGESRRRLQPRRRQRQRQRQKP
ncbi:hypothetical protein B0T10DRAFT_547925 [Thelonectria olida]|uniref:Vacuolar ATPase assembly protein VMA22 n=1 Tax=Thelonectria olida TaxID=1576542 RepID=A0A9P9AT24_9HYPO|nr:hypothetical protein B0T10DRAFT_547925 [Thelonectria olida]